jgi:hypothetical protein
MDKAVEQLTFSSQDSALKDRTLEVSAVVFEDGTSEGWQPHIDSIFYSHSGRILETERIKNILASMNSHFAGDSDVKILTEKIGSLPESADHAFDELAAVGQAAGLSMSNLQPHGTAARGAFLSGVRSAREEMLWQLDHLRELPATSADPSALTRAGFLFHLRQQYDEKTIRYRAFLKRTRGGKEK